MTATMIPINRTMTIGYNIRSLAMAHMCACLYLYMYIYTLSVCASVKSGLVMRAKYMCGTEVGHRVCCV